MALTKISAAVLKTGIITVNHLHTSHGITTSTIGEGSNLFYTDARVSGYLSTNSYANPAWITSLAYSKITGVPAFITGISFANVSSKPTTLSGYGITDAASSTHTHTFASLTSKPTTLSGYGITDAASSANVSNWNTAYGWGNHASAGYLTSVTNITGNAGTATKLLTARAIAVSGAVTGTANFDGSGNISIATTHTADPVITLAGDVTGSGTMTNLGSVSITTVVGNDSHTHSTYLPLAGGTMSGDIIFNNNIRLEYSTTHWITPRDSSGNMHLSTTTGGIYLDAPVIYIRENGSESNKITIDNGTLTATGTISGSNLSGTNTGDQTNISGNAATATLAANSTLAGGLAVATGVNSGVNQIVRTQANGYCDFGWINSVSGNHGGSITRITASNDAYLRYVTPAQFRSGVIDGYYLPLSGGTMSGNLVLKSISCTDQMVENTYGAYLHLGDWGVARTAATAVLVNTAYRADYATYLFDMNISRFTNNSGYITSSGSISGYASYLPTAYVGGQQTNPQVYFNNGVGLKAAMTGAWSVWSDTLWINGYSGSDVLQMCALHTLRNGTPRMAISVQASTSTSYGTFYEFITAYNIGSQSVNYATSAGTASNISAYTINQSVGTGNSPTFAGGTITNTLQINRAASVYLHVNRTDSTNSANLLLGAQQYANALYSRISATNSAARVFYMYSGSTVEFTLATSGVMSGDFNDTSDVLLKKNIEYHNYGLDAINSLKPREFNWKRNTRPQGKQIGFIAQEVEEIIPEVIHGYDGAKSINTTGLVSILTKAIQELSQELNALKAEVELLKQ